MVEESPRIVEKARSTIKGFEDVYQKILQAVVLQGKSVSTLNNYMRRVSALCLHFGRLPENISDDEVNQYLTDLALGSKSPSRSQFKHTVYGLRFYFRHIGYTKRMVFLPKIKDDKNLPVILNRTELKSLFCSPTNLKHRVVLALAYSAGLRSKELINLKESDIDFERMTIHIRKSKYNKDRVVPLSKFISKGLKRYIRETRPINWLFNGSHRDGRYSSRGLSWIMKSALKYSGITKTVSLHSLRHSYATHLLEEGVNIVQIKELLGHAHVSTTMIYLHVAQRVDTNVHSPLDTLYPDQC